MVEFDHHMIVLDREDVKKVKNPSNVPPQQVDADKATKTLFSDVEIMTNNLQQKLEKYLLPLLRKLVNGQTDRQTEGQTDGQTDGRTTPEHRISSQVR